MVRLDECVWVEKDRVDPISLLFKMLRFLQFPFVIKSIDLYMPVSIN